ncbi:MAG TPA: nucleotidyl transferase AbiEii/AbiGii toxin family protein, partial [Flavisolibacter sp.]|nr:nucleotidyl transferase AbiEii/AbiGii toxin family protein [Flavisolibacter sp.]
KGELGKNQLDKLRKISCAFVSNDLKVLLEKELQTLGASLDQFSLAARELKSTDTDPEVLELQYQSVTGNKEYLPERVLIEVGSRSLIEPHVPRQIQSLIDETYPGQDFSSTPFSVASVIPERTFLEKIMLLHEEFLKIPEKFKPNRMSRHLYDLHRLMDTPYGINAVKDKRLFKIIAEHRQKFTPIRGLDYSLHTPQTINLIPPENIINEWETDYKVMQTNMIYGDAPSFKELLKRMNILMDRLKNQEHNDKE